MKTETAQVYRSQSGRRYFTKLACIKSDFRFLIRSKERRCFCERGHYENDYPPEVCHYHDDSGKFEKSQARYIRYRKHLAKKGKD